MATTIAQSKCVLVTGATSGIGRALAKSIQALPNQPTVIGTGRRLERLEELKASGIHPFQLELDVDRDSLKKSVDELIENYPEIDTIVLNAGMQRQTNIKKGLDLDAFSSEVNVNYLSVVAMINFFLPHLLELSKTRPCFIIVVTSGISLLPNPLVAGYCATKAALHSFTTSLYHQLSDTNIKVIEVSPPLVESELHEFEGMSEQLSKVWMPLDEFTKVTMEGLLKGEQYVAAGMGLIFYERHEKAKNDTIKAFWEQSSKHLKN